MPKVTITIETDDSQEPNNLHAMWPQVRLPKAQSLPQLPKEESKVKKLFTFVGFIFCLYLLYVLVSALLVIHAR